VVSAKFGENFWGDDQDSANHGRQRHDVDRFCFLARVVDFRRPKILSVAVATPLLFCPELD
jgi:hypothetical protein